MITKQQAEKLVRKLGFRPTGKGKELGFKYEHRGVTILFTAVPKGRGPLYITDKFRKQLKLNRDQFEGGLSCPFKAADYLNHLVQIGEVESA